MPPRKPRTPSVDMDALAAALAAGKIVRVGLVASSQFPEGGVGRIRAIGDPAVDGEEYVQVEVSVGGAKDVLPFAPSDLTPAVRGAAKRTATEPKPAAPAPAAPAGPVWTPAPAPTPAAARPATPGTTASPDTAATAAAPARKPSRATDRPRGKRAPVTITISTTGEDNLGWQIHVQQGSRTVVKSTPLLPIRAWELVSGLDNDDLTAFVAGILAEHRAQTQARAEKLAAELAAIRSELDGYPAT